MNHIIKTTLLGLFFGTFGTTIGGIIGGTSKNIPKKILGFILEFAAGLMTSIVCFDLMPKAFVISSAANNFIGFFIGVCTMIICDILITKKFKRKKGLKTNSLIKTGTIIGIGLALHNFPEGLAIGSGFEASFKMGISLALAIAIHDIPEGMSMAVPMKSGGLKTKKVIIYTFASGLTTGLGALLGALAGNVSKELIGLNLAFAAGAMLYIISGELIPESNKIHDGKISYIGNILGFMAGIIATKI